MPASKTVCTQAVGTIAQLKQQETKAAIVNVGLTRLCHFLQSLLECKEVSERQVWPKLALNLFCNLFHVLLAEAS